MVMKVKITGGMEDLVTGLLGLLTSSLVDVHFLICFFMFSLPSSKV